MRRIFSGFCLAFIIILMGCSVESGDKIKQDLRVIVKYNDQNLGEAVLNNLFSVHHLENLENFIVGKTDNIVIIHEPMPHGTMTGELVITRQLDESYEITNNNVSLFEEGTHSCENIDAYGFGLILNKCLINDESIFETVALPLSTRDTKSIKELIDKKIIEK
ncbi:hypothetical protein ACFSCX_13390 [Bacillus salitolerans]|uniref:Lipoprotein n=1 Tax=Bacillus salitolerans TaxID=1437434 RepID=A0ABW4LTY1_9BACI